MLDAIFGLEQALVADGGVIIRGESGTGGEVFARAIHLSSASPRRRPVAELLAQAIQTTSPDGSPLVVFDCAVANGVESRLIGTTSDRVSGSGPEAITESSAVHQARGGTLVLRNLPDLPGRVQARLGRILHDGEALVMPARQVRRIDVRPIALVEPADEDRIHGDLRRSLSQTTITMPPLRDRREDLPALIRYLLVDICTGLGIEPKRASRQAVALLAALPWRGNVEELEALLRVLVLQSREHLVRQADVLAHIRLEGAAPALTYTGSLRQARARFEREYVASVLKHHNGRMAEAAKTLGIQRTNLYRKVRQLSVRRPASRRSS